MTDETQESDMSWALGPSKVSNTSPGPLRQVLSTAWQPSPLALQRGES